VSDDNGTALYTPVRVGVESQLALGARVRLSIESPHEGYLYVIDRETYADGTKDKALMIFPTTRTRNGDNHVRAGVLIDIPAQEDTPPYFTLNSEHVGYAGEVLTVIITQQPIKGLTIDRTPQLISAPQLSAWEKEWGAEAERFELEEATGQTWTPEEKSASHISGRALTQEEPSPQTLYRAIVRAGKPLLITIPLRVRASR
jgi:hypothetical protein